MSIPGNLFSLILECSKEWMFGYALNGCFLIFILCVMIEHETDTHASILCIQQGCVLCYGSCSSGTGSFQLNKGMEWTKFELA